MHDMTRTGHVLARHALVPWESIEGRLEPDGLRDDAIAMHANPRRTVRRGRPLARRRPPRPHLAGRELTARRLRAKTLLAIAIPTAVRRARGPVLLPHR